LKPIARQYGAGPETGSMPHTGNTPIPNRPHHSGAGPENSPYSGTGTGTGTSQTGNIPIANVPIGNTVIKVYFRRIVLFFYYFIL
jgi:hypothetical protein